MTTMVIYFYLFIVSLKILSTDTSSIRSWNYENDVVPFSGARGDVAKRDSNTLKVVSNEPFIIELPMPSEGETQKKERGREKKKKRRRPAKKRVAKSKPSRKKHRNKRDVRSTELKPVPMNLKFKTNQIERGNSTKYLKLVNSTALKPVIRPQEIIKLLHQLQEIKKEKISKAQTEAQNRTTHRPQPTTQKMAYPTTPKPDPEQKYTYNDVMTDRERLENKIKYLKNLFSVNETNATNDTVRIRRKAESDKVANKIAKMFLTLSAMNGLQEKRKTRCKEGEDEDDVEGVWEEAERRDTPVRKNYSYNEERYKVKKWIEHMKNKRSHSKTCPCMTNYAYADYNDDGDIFPLEQKLAKDYTMAYADHSSEESMENIRGRPQVWGRPNRNNGYGSRYSRPSDGPTKFLFQKRGRRKLDLPIEDLELYRSRAKQILRNAEEILDKIKEEEEKRLAAPSVLLSQLREMTSRIQSDPRSTENELMRIIQKNLGLGTQGKAEDGDKGTFLDNLKTFIIDPYEKAKSLTDESAKELSTYLLRNLGKLDTSPQETSGDNKKGMQIYHGQEPQNRGGSLASANLEKDNSTDRGVSKLLKRPLYGVRLFNEQDGGSEDDANKEDPIQKKMEDMLKEQEEKVKNYTEPPGGEKNLSFEDDVEKDTKDRIRGNKGRVPTGLRSRIKGKDSKKPEDAVQKVQPEEISGRDENDVAASKHLFPTEEEKESPETKAQEELENSYDTFGYPFSRDGNEEEKEITDAEKSIVAQKHPLGGATESKEPSGITEIDPNGSLRMDERNENDVVASKHLVDAEDGNVYLEDPMLEKEKAAEESKESELVEGSFDKVKSLGDELIDSLIKEQDPSKADLQTMKETGEGIAGRQFVDDPESIGKLSSDDLWTGTDAENLRLIAQSKEALEEDGIVRAENQDAETPVAADNVFGGINEDETLRAERIEGSSERNSEDGDVDYDRADEDETLRAVNAQEPIEEGRESTVDSEVLKEANPAFDLDEVDGEVEDPNLKSQLEVGEPENDAILRKGQEFDPQAEDRVRGVEDRDGIRSQEIGMGVKDQDSVGGVRNQDDGTERARSGEDGVEKIRDQEDTARNQDLEDGGDRLESAGGRITGEKTDSAEKVRAQEGAPGIIKSSQEEGAESFLGQDDGTENVESSQKGGVGGIRDLEDGAGGLESAARKITSQEDGDQITESPEDGTDKAKGQKYKPGRIRGQKGGVGKEGDNQEDNVQKTENPEEGVDKLRDLKNKLAKIRGQKDLEKAGGNQEDGVEKEESPEDGVEKAKGPKYKIGRLRGRKGGLGKAGDNQDDDAEKAESPEEGVDRLRDLKNKLARLRGQKGGLKRLGNNQEDGEEKEESTEDGPEKVKARKQKAGRIRGPKGRYGKVSNDQDGAERSEGSDYGAEGTEDSDYGDRLESAGRIEDQEEDDVGKAEGTEGGTEKARSRKPKIGRIRGLKGRFGKLRNNQEDGAERSEDSEDGAEGTEDSDYGDRLQSAGRIADQEDDVGKAEGAEDGTEKARSRKPKIGRIRGPKGRFGKLRNNQEDGAERSEDSEDGAEGTEDSDYGDRLQSAGRIEDQDVEKAEGAEDGTEKARSRKPKIGRIRGPKGRFGKLRNNQEDGAEGTEDSDYGDRLESTGRQIASEEDGFAKAENTEDGADSIRGQKLKAGRIKGQKGIGKVGSSHEDGTERILGQEEGVGSIKDFEDSADKLESAMRRIIDQEDGLGNAQTAEDGYGRVLGQEDGVGKVGSSNEDAVERIRDSEDGADRLESTGRRIEEGVVRMTDPEDGAGRMTDPEYGVGRMTDLEDGADRLESAGGRIIGQGDSVEKVGSSPEDGIAKMTELDDTRQITDLEDGVGTMRDIDGADKLENTGRRITGQEDVERSTEGEIERIRDLEGGTGRVQYSQEDGTEGIRGQEGSVGSIRNQQENSLGSMRDLEDGPDRLESVGRRITGQEDGGERIGSMEKGIEKAISQEDGIERARGHEDSAGIIKDLEDGVERVRSSFGGDRGSQEGFGIRDPQDDVRKAGNSQENGVGNIRDSANRLGSAIEEIAGQEDGVGRIRDLEDGADRLESAGRRITGQEDDDENLGSAEKDDFERVQGQDTVAQIIGQDGIGRVGTNTEDGVEGISGQVDSVGGTQDDFGEMKGIGDELGKIKSGQETSIEGIGDGEEDNVEMAREQEDGTDMMRGDIVEKTQSGEGDNVERVREQGGVEGLKGLDDIIEKIRSQEDNLERIRGSEEDGVGSVKDPGYGVDKVISSEDGVGSARGQESIKRLGSGEKYGFDKVIDLEDGVGRVSNEGDSVEMVRTGEDGMDERVRSSMEDPLRRIIGQDGIERIGSSKEGAGSNQDVDGLSDGGDGAEKIGSEEVMSVRNQDVKSVDDPKEIRGEGGSVGRIRSQEGDPEVLQSQGVLGASNVNDPEEISQKDGDENVRGSSEGGVGGVPGQDVLSENNVEGVESPEKDIRDPLLQAFEKHGNRGPSFKSETQDPSFPQPTENLASNVDENLLKAISQELEALEGDGDDTLRSTHVQSTDETQRSAHSDEMDDAESDEFDDSIAPAYEHPGQRNQYTQTGPYLKSVHEDLATDPDMNSPLQSTHSQEDLRFDSREHDLPGIGKPFSLSSQILEEGLQRLDNGPIQVRRKKVKIPFSIGRIMSDLDGENEKDLSIQSLDPDKIDHFIGKIGEAEQQNIEDGDVDCMKECACADQINTRSRNIGRYEIVKDFLHWMKDLQLNRVLSD